ncbi:MAG: hypothetical protein QM734_02115 [Cyclobacteriaceae bacterium]
MKQEVNKVKLAFYIISSTLIITFVFYGYQICFTANVLVDREDRPFTIHQGDTYQTVLKNLGESDFVGDMVSFSFLAKLTDFDKEMMPGRYILRRNMT